MKKYPIPSRFLFLVIASLPLTALSQPASVNSKIKHFGKNNPFKVNDLPRSFLKSKLLILPSGPQKKAVDWLNQFAFTEPDLEHLRADNEGGIFFSDTFTLPSNTIAAAKAGTIAAPQPISSVDAFKLHSKPGVTNIIYVDFDGHVITGTAWNSGGPSSYSAKPYDIDNNPSFFSAPELAAIHEIWHRIAEDYAPFNVDVTTQLPASFGPTVGRILITHNIDNNGKQMPAYGAGGVAYMGVWGASNYATYYSPALVYYNTLGPGFSPYIAEAASHEMGHNLGLNHDGTSAQGYYGGHGSGFISWGPIMGTGYDRNVSQWSIGEYTAANNQEDDIAKISTKLTYRTDDHSDIRTSATPLLVDAGGAIAVTNPENDPFNTIPNNKGIIGKRDDVDYFKFTAGAGAVQINVTPAWTAFTRNDNRGANLDIQATLYDPNGNQLMQVDPTDSTNAQIITTLGTTGTYYLSVTGVGNTISPYSDYGSLGEYFISGTVKTSSSADTTAPTPNPMTWLVTPNAGGSSNSISMQATVATDASGPVQYMFVCASGGVGCVSSNWQTSNQYTATGLAAATTYNFQVKAKDALGNTTSLSAMAAATTAAAPTVDTTPPTPNPMTWLVAPNAGGSSNSISMQATAATDASGPVQYMFVCASGGTGCVSSSWQTSNQYTATGLAAATAYSFQVKAKDANGNTTGLSASASATTASASTNVPLTPTGLMAVSGTKTSVTLAWSAVSNATSYQLWRCTLMGSICNYGSTPYANTTVPSYRGAVPSAYYVRFKVKAVNSAGASGFSNEIQY